MLLCNGIHPFGAQLHIWHLCLEQFSKYRRLIDHWRSVPHVDVRDGVLETSTGAIPLRLSCAETYFYAYIMYKVTGSRGRSYTKAMCEQMKREKKKKKLLVPTPTA